MRGARIPRTRLVRRAGAQRWHLARYVLHGRSVTECGQTIRATEHSTTTDAGRIDCYECLTDALSRRLGERAAREAVQR